MEGDLIELFSGSYTTNCELLSFEATTEIFIRTHIRRKLRHDISIKWGRLTNIIYDGMDRAYFDIEIPSLKLKEDSCAKCKKDHYFIRMWNIKEISPGIVKYDYTAFLDNRCNLD